MKISTKGRYSLRMMIDLAQHYDNELVALKDISERQGISKKYLEQIVPFLNRSHLLISSKGHHGGYRLARDPSEITVCQILESAEGSLAPVSCLDNEPNICEHCDVCLTLPIYTELYERIRSYLDSITLADIMNQDGVHHICNF